MIIRRAFPADAEGLARVDIDSHVAAYAHVFDVSRYASGPAQFVALWQRLTGPESPWAPSEVYVAELGGIIEGYAICGPSRDEDGGGIGEVGALYVHPDRWRQGIGAALLAAAYRELSARGFTEATLWVVEANAQARAFYVKEGWLADGLERTVHDRAELRYRRTL